MTLRALKKYERSEYQPLSPRIKQMGTLVRADKRGWGPGWPNCQTNKITQTGLVVRPRDGWSFSRPMRREVAELARFLLQATQDLGASKGFELRKASEPGGGISSFNCRAIRGTNSPSNHSWGLAIDLNSASNPLSSTWRATNPPWMVDLWESAGWNWGGRYPKSNPYDAMHFEYVARPGDVSADLARAQSAFERLWLPDHPELARGSTGPHVKRGQELLNAHGAKLEADGIFGRLTKAAVTDFQTKNELVPDGGIGKFTWLALERGPRTL
jgi:hypothetical protein